MPSRSAILRLHNYIVDRHWHDEVLIGPDPGVRLNYRIGRFIKGYLPFISWHDDYYYLQAQGYWVLANWWLHALTGSTQFRTIAISCSAQMLARQRDDGAWPYPHPEWRGRVATAEGTWAAIGLLESYRQTANPMFLEGALRWHAFLNEHIGYQPYGEGVSINYFAGRNGVQVPNNSIFVLRFLADLANATGEHGYLSPCKGLLAFVAKVQQPNGEFPYAVSSTGDDNRMHFQCFQYNAFQCLDLVAYYRLTRDEEALRLARATFRFLSGGLGADGSARYACNSRHRTVLYHTAVLGAAFAQATQLGMAEYEQHMRQAYAYLLMMQRSDGGFIHSRRDYRVLDDYRSYPRYLAMILYHLLIGADVSSPEAARPADVLNGDA